MDQNDLRYIQHNFQISGHSIDSEAGKAILIQMKKDVMCYFIKQFKKFQEKVNIPCLSDLCVVPEKSRNGWDLFTGSGGYLLLYIRMYEFFASLTEEEKDLYMKIAKDSLTDEQVMQYFDQDYHLSNAYSQFVALEEFSQQRDDKYISYFFSKASIFQMGCQISFYRQDLDRFKIYLAKILTYYDKIRQTIEKQVFDLLYGVPGYIYILLQLQTNFGNENAGNFKVDVKDQILQLCKLVVQEGYRNFNKQKDFTKIDPLPDNFMLTYEFYGQKYIGGAHGLLGNIQILLLCYDKYKEFFEFADAGFTKILLRGIDSSLKTLKKLQFAETGIFQQFKKKTGNFPCTTDPQDNLNNLVQFCHGAPGAVAPLLQASQIFKNNDYLNMAKKAADCVWKFGVLKKGPGICHGIPGNGYVFLQLYCHSKELKYLEQAYKFITYENDQKIVEGIKNFAYYDRFSQSYKQLFQTEESLMLGKAGNLITQLDFLMNGVKGFPGYQI